MTFAPKTATLALALGSTLMLAACGGSPEVSDEAGEQAAGESVVVSPAAGDAAVAPGEAAPTPEPTATETPEPAPSASPSAAPTTAAAAPAPAAVAAAKPPEFAVCAACHSTEPGKNGLGPTLAGVYNAKAGHIASFDYSEAMEGSGLAWNDGNLDRFLTDPQGVIPGTKMAYPGLKDAAKRRAMIAYLKSL